MKEPRDIWSAIKRNRRDIVRVTILAAVVIGVIVVTHGWWNELKDALMRTPPAMFFVLFCILPMAGVSIVLLQMVVGLRFGAEWGLVVVAAATAVHLAGMHVIARSLLRGTVERMLQRRGHSLPDLARREPVSVALLGALVPGLPYSIRNYLLALSDVPFRIYGPICWAIYVGRSFVTIMLGHWATELTPQRITILTVIYVTKFSACAAIVWHLRRRNKLTPAPAAADRHAR